MDYFILGQGRASRRGKFVPILTGRPVAICRCAAVCALRKKLLRQWRRQRAREVEVKSSTDELSRQIESATTGELETSREREKRERVLQRESAGERDSSDAKAQQAFLIFHGLFTKRTVYRNLYRRFAPPVQIDELAATSVASDGEHAIERRWFRTEFDSLLSGGYRPVQRDVQRALRRGQRAHVWF